MWVLRPKRPRGRAALGALRGDSGSSERHGSHQRALTGGTHAGSATSAGQRAVLVTQESKRWGGVAKAVLPPSTSGIDRARGKPNSSASGQRMVSGRITWEGCRGRCLAKAPSARQKGDVSFQDWKS